VTPRPVGVSFVLPVYNGRRWLQAVLDGIELQRDGRDFEIIAIDDGSADGSRRVLAEEAAAGRLRLIDGPHRGSAAAINIGIREARHPIVCQVDQDVVLQQGWLAELLKALEDPAVAAAQGMYVTAADAGFWARVMGRDLEQRYSRLRSAVDHVCTGNTAYRASALHQVGLLDEGLGYGSDNDLSYRLTAAGYTLAFCSNAVSVHRWREEPREYLRQQFGVGYGRLDVLARHPSRAAGDDVSGAIMMAHGPVMLASLLTAGAGVVAKIAHQPPRWWFVGSAVLVGILAAERLVASLRAWRRSRDAAALGFCVAHLLRDVMWSAAIVLWMYRYVGGRATSPSHSMHRLAGRITPADRDAFAGAARVLAIVPAYNEAGNLPRVIAELRRFVPWFDVLIVNDGSVDDTPDLLPRLGVRWLTLGQRVGVGGAVRAGLRFAAREGYEYVVRIDGDGQHRAADIPRLLGPVLAGRCDAVIGSRFLARGRRRPPTLRRTSQHVLGWWLTAFTGQRVTDPTSGFWLFGPRAVGLLGRHHPTGYAEPELVLFLSRNNLRVGEMPIRMRPRMGGRTSLTPARTALALARTALALMIVPLRRVIEAPGRD
jgi:glycosyltransferase involved in cell wall biosynthesis